MKMVKRTLIAIAVVALLATSVQAGIDGALEVFGEEGAGKLKTEGKDKVFWPWEYVALDLCTFDVYMEIGYYVEVEDCGDKKLTLKQVDCGDLKNTDTSWPCYMGCEDVTIRSNFDVILGLGFDKTGINIIDKYDVFYKYADVNSGTLQLEAGVTSFQICMEAWAAKLWESDASPGESQKVGEITITVKPAV
jgi:hypothetical protein